jgi:hypothetical protein
MIDREVLTSEKVNELLHSQSALQAESHAVLAELHLLELLAAVGYVRQVGSSVHGLMVWRDIDLNVSAAGVQIHQMMEALHPLFVHPCVKRIRYLKEVGRFNPAAEPVHDRHYFGVYYLPFERQVEWKIDISFWLCGEHPEPVHDALTEHLTQEKRLAILLLKEIWHRLPAYRHQVYSIDIYDAVLEQGVRTPSAFDAYLAARGKPTRTEQAR